MFVIFHVEQRFKRRRNAEMTITGSTAETGSGIVYTQREVV